MVRALGLSAALFSISTLGPAEELAPAEKRVVDLINKARDTLGRPLVQACPALSKIARSHTLEMVSEGYVGHRSPETGTPRDRVQDAKISASRVVEHIVQAAGPDAAHKRLVEDDEYQNNIVDRDFELAGVGIVPKGKGSYLFTILLVDPIEAVDIGKEIKRLIGAANAKRRTQGSPELKLHSGLSDLALKTTQIMNRKGSLMPGDTIREGMKSVGLEYAKYRSFHRYTKELDGVLSAPQLYGPAFGQIGLAILRNDHPRKTFGAYWVVAILVEPK